MKQMRCSTCKVMCKGLINNASAPCGMAQTCVDSPKARLGESASEPQRQRRSGRGSDVKVQACIVSWLHPGSILETQRHVPFS